MVIYTDEGAGEGQYLAKGNEYGVVDFASRNSHEPARKQCAPEGAHRYGEYELGLSHRVR